MNAVVEAREPSAKYLSALQLPLVQHFELMANASGGVAKLRELILTLAVRGKLVPQDPNEEAASVLLKDIQAEKDQLVAEGKRKVDKPQSDITADEQPFSLPDGWEWAKLGKLTTQITDGTHHTPTYLESGVAFISVKDIDGNTVSFADCKFISEDEHRQINARCCPERGDLLLCRIGTLGRPTLVDTDRPFSLFVSVGLLKLPKSCNISAYLHLAMKSPLLVAQYDAIKAGGSHTNKLNLGDIPRLAIPVPPLAEQARIVTRVEELMRLCDALEAKDQLEAAQHAQLVQTLLGALTGSTSPDELADNWQRVATHFDLLLDRPEAIDALEQTILQLAVRGLLVPQDPKDEPASELLKKIRAEKDRLIAEGRIKPDKPLADIADEEIPFEAPQSWVWARLGEVVSISSGITLGRKTAIPAPVSYPYLRVANVQRWHLNLSSMKEVVIDRSELARFQLAKGDLLITEGGDWDKVGRTTIWRDELPVCLHQNHVFKARGMTAEWNAIWAELYLNSTVARAYFASSAKQTTNLASINMTQLKGCVFPLPPLAEQSRIVTRVESLRRLCADLRQRLAARQTTQAHLAEALIDEVA